MGGTFLPSFLGLAATRVWLQVNLFASYTQSDDGLFTVVNNLAYGLVMVIGAAIALHKPFSKGGRTAVAWLGFTVMTFSTVLILAGKETGAVEILAVASVLAGIGGALGGGMWTAAYVRLGLRQSVLYGFLSLALGSVGGLAVFGLALGISRGFPAGEPVPMDALQRVVHQMGVVIISLFIIWWFIVKRKRLSFSFLWRIEIMLVAVGMLILSVFPGHFTGLAIATVNIADTLMLGVLWITLQDVARHATTDVYAVYGFAWASRVLSRDAGRVLIMVLGAVGASSYAVTAVIGIVVFALAASMALLLSDGILKLRPLFTEDVAAPAPRSAAGAARETRRAEMEGAGAAAPTPAAMPSAQAQPDPQEWFRDAFDLSERETEVALLIAQGRSKSYIAEALCLSENTVRTHAKNVYTKLDVHSKQELIDLLQNRE